MYTDRTTEFLYWLLAMFVVVIVVALGLLIARPAGASEPDIFSLLQRIDEQMQTDSELSIQVFVKTMGDKSAPYGRIVELRSAFVCVDSAPGQNWNKWCIPLQEIAYIGSNKPIAAQ